MMQKKEKKLRNKSERLLEPKQLVMTGKVIVIMHVLPIYQADHLGLLRLLCVNKGHFGEVWIKGLIGQRSGCA